MSNIFSKVFRKGERENGLNVSSSPSRSRTPSRGRAPEPQAQKESIGLFELSDPSERTTIDVVAVHGLQGDAFKTWEHENGFLWLREFQPPLSYARILTFGYNSTIAFSNSVAKLEDKALDLLNRLSGDRATHDIKARKTRPIVFIGHSLGGILIKKALILAHNRSSDPEYKDILDNTKAIAFLAVPHKGSDSAWWATFAANLLNTAAMGTSTNTAIVADLKRDSSALINISNEFVDRAKDLTIYTFYETQRLGGLQIVDTLSAQIGLPNEKLFPVDADHRRICKVPSADSQAYKAVCFWIAKLVESTASRSQQEEPQLSGTGNGYRAGSPTLESFVSNRDIRPAEQSKVTSSERARMATASFIGRFDEIIRGSHCVVPYRPNLKFVGRERLLEDLRAKFKVVEGPQARLALFGLGGVGKSQIALEYAYKLRSERPELSIFWVYAGTADKFQQGYNAIAKEIGIPGWNDPLASTLDLVKAWLSDERSCPWLMIIDNADDSDIFFGAATDPTSAVESALNLGNLSRYIPENPNGGIIFTTRNKQAGLELIEDGELIDIPPMSDEEAKLLIKSRLKTTVTEDFLMEKLVKLLEYLPLAIVQAAASIDRKSQTIGEYLQLFEGIEASPLRLLKEDFGDPRRDRDGKNAVFKTWAISFHQIRRDSLLAANILSLMSLCAPQGIPKWLLMRQTKSEMDLEDALGVLKGFSLITPSHDRQSVDLHRLVQLCTRGWLQEQNEYSTWVDTATVILSNGFPDDDPENWDKCALLLPHAQSVLATQPPSGKSTELATLMYNVARYQETQGKYKASEHLHRLALKLREKALGKEHQDTLSSSHGLATVLRDLGEYESSERLHRYTLEARTRTLGPDHPDSLSSASSLCDVLWDRQKYDEAERFNKQALEGRTKVLGGRHKDTLQSLTNHVAWQGYHGEYITAEATCQDLVANTQDVLGSNHPLTLRCKSVLASFFNYLGKFKDAERLWRQVLEARETMYGMDHPETLSTLDGLSETLANQGNYADAEQICRRALEGFQRVLGQDHPEAAWVYFNLGSLLLRERKYAEAENAFSHVADRFKNIEDAATVLNSCHVLYSLQMQGKSSAVEEGVAALTPKVHELDKRSPNALSAIHLLGLLFSGLRKHGEAESYLQLALQSRMKVRGEGHPDTLISVHELAALKHGQREYEAAEELFRKVITAREKALGQDHPETLRSVSALAILLHDQKRYDEAEQLYQRALAGQQKTFGERHSETLTSMSNLAILLKDQLRYKESEEMYERSLAGRETYLGKDHPDTLSSLNGLAVLMHRVGNYDRAEKLCRQALTAHERVLGQDHEDTLLSVNNLANFLDSRQQYKESEQLYLRVLEVREKAVKEVEPGATWKLGTDGASALLTAKANVAAVKRHLGMLSEAEKLEEEVLKERQKGGNSTDSVLEAMANLALTKQKNGKLSEAEQLQQEVLEERKKGNDESSILSAMAALAITKRSLRKLSEAELLESHVLEGYQKLEGEEDLVLVALENLAITKQYLEKLSEAEQLGEEVLEARKKSGKNEYYTLIAAGNLAVTKRLLGKLEEAEILQEQVLSSTKQRFAEDTMMVVNSMTAIANTKLELGKIREGLELHERAVELTSQLYPEDHPSMLDAMSGLAAAFSEGRRWSEAEELGKKVLKLTEQQFSEEHPRVPYALLSLGVLYEARDDLQTQTRSREAYVYRLRALRIRQRVLGPDHPDTISAMDVIAMVYPDSENEAALDMMRKVVEWRTKNLGADHLMTVRSKYRFAIILMTLGRFSEALAVQRHVLRVRERRLGPENLDTIDTKEMMALSYFYQSEYENASPLLQEVVDIRRRILGADHPLTISAQDLLGRVVD